MRASGRDIWKHCGLSAGFMWHSVRRTVKDYGVESTVTTFIPWDSNVEIIQ